MSIGPGELAEERKPAEPGKSGERHSGSVARVLLALLILLVIYVLSIGPAYKLYRRGTISDPTFTVVYGPVMKFSAVCPPFNRFVRWYLRVIWGVRY